MKRVILLLLCALTVLLLSGCAERAAVGVIGGADGPTTIIITGPGSILPAE